MARLDVTTIRLPVPDDRLDDLLPADLAELARTLYRRRDEVNNAHSAVAATKVAIGRAQEADADALGKAIAAGDPDPGPVHHRAAVAAHDEAKRRAAGHEKAEQAAARELYGAMADTDRAALVDRLDDAAVAESDRARGLLDDLAVAIAEVKVLRELSLYLAHFPERSPGGLDYDHQDAQRTIANARDLFDRLAPGRALVRSW